MIKPDKVEALPLQTGLDQKLALSGLETYYYFRKVNFCFSTDGKGHWSRKEKQVSHKKIGLKIFDPKSNPSFQLNVYFNKKDWNVSSHGLIYTDESWLKDLANELSKMGFKNTRHINYSEQGMQGDNYVNLDVTKDFSNQFFKLLYNNKHEKLLSFVNGDIGKHIYG
jgi:hypothetical protein